MRIAIDARELYGKPTGVGRYLGKILAAWNSLPAAAAHQVILIAPQEADVQPPDPRRLSTITGRGNGTLWEQITLPRLVRRAGADVLFAPGYTGPIRCAVPMVVAIHDVSFAAHPEWFRWREGLRRRTLTGMAARRAARVVTISEFSKREIVIRLGVDAGRIDVIYPGASGRSVERATAPPLADAPGPRSATFPTRAHESRTSEHVVLHVGSVFNRRHVPELIEGFARLARRRADARLEIVGDNRTTPHLDLDRVANATGIGDRIRVRSYVADDELASLYGGARVFAFLSEYEGFGLTPIEALAADVPIIVLDTAVAREVYGAAAFYVDRPDPATIEATLERALFNEAARRDVLDAAREVLARYSWRDCAARVLDVLLSAAQPRRL